jgi:hypothetical protein
VNHRVRSPLRSRQRVTRRAPHDSVVPPRTNSTEILADVRDELLAHDPALADFFASFNRRAEPWWARPVPWLCGSVLVLAAMTAAVWLVALAALGVIALLLLLGALVLVPLAASPDGG